MKLEQSFEVAAPIAQVWDALVDVERVAPCLPGASLTGRNEDGSFNGALTIKIGPTTAAYAGKLEMENIDEGAHTATMQAQGTDKRGQGGAKATINSKLSEIDGATRVEVVTDYQITGRLARFGRGGMIEDISQRLLRQFAGCLQSSLVGAEHATAATAAPAATAAAAAEPAPDQAPATADATAPAAPPSAEATAGAQAPPVAEPTAEAQAASTPEAGQPLNALPLVAGVVKDRARKNPVPIVALVVGFVLAAIILRRRGRS
jgi:uncharacterized protein